MSGKAFFRTVSVLVLAAATAAAAGAQKGGGGGGGGGGGDTSAVNNLSLPVIWSDGVTKALPGTYGAPVFEGESFTDESGVVWYLQQDPDNRWQAESSDESAAPFAVHWIDWGDNLESKPWYLTSQVRVETVLYQDLVDPLVGFQMGYLWGEGTDEMWGTNAVQYPSYQATVYSGCARLTIQKLAVNPDVAVLAWNPALARWEGDVTGVPLFSSGVWEGSEGEGEAPRPGTGASVYSAEINIGGKIIYGHNWNVRKNNLGAGYYRLTFSLDAVHCPATVNTFFVEGVTQIFVTTEDPTYRTRKMGKASVGNAAEPGGGVAAIDFVDNLTYIDVQILARGSR